MLHTLLCTIVAEACITVLYGSIRQSFSQPVQDPSLEEILAQRPTVIDEKQFVMLRDAGVEFTITECFYHDMSFNTFDMTIRYN